MKSKSMKRKIVTLLFALCAIFAFSATVMADDANEVIKDSRNGIVQVNLVFQDPNGSLHELQGGTGFVVNSEYVLTCYHVTHLDVDSDVYYYAKKKWGREFTEHLKDRLKLRIVLKSDLSIAAEEINGSEVGDYSILQLQSTVNGKKALPLGNSSEVSPSQEIWALGFPADVADYKKGTIYTTEDVDITSGTIEKVSVIDGVNFLQHSAKLSSGSSGGPLLDSNGNVIGINKAVLKNNMLDSVFYSVAINDVKDTLDTLGIEYTDGPGNVVTPTEDETGDVESTEEVVTEPPTLAPLTTAAADESTEKGMSTGLIIGIVAGVVVLIIVIILIIVLATKGKGKGPKGGAPQPMPSRPVPPTPAAPVQPQPTAPQFSAGEGSNETTVLNEGGGETTLLGIGQPTATLLRMKNGEKVSINRPEFTIGKERRRVDYCISDNNSVSRCHTKIISRNGQYFVMDLNSTNFTYVNGSKIAPNQETALANGDKIKLSDEEFEFRTV